MNGKIHISFEKKQNALMVLTVTVITLRKT